MNTDVRFTSAALPGYDDVQSRERMRDWSACRFAEDVLDGDDAAIEYSRESYIFWRDEAARLDALRARYEIRSPHPGALLEYFEHLETWRS